MSRLKKKREKAKRKRRLKSILAKKKFTSEKPKQPVVNELTESQRTNELRNQAILREAGINIHLPNPAHAKDKSFLALRSRIMWSERPRATYHELLFENLNKTLGKEWIEKQEKKTKRDRHFIYECFRQLDEYLSSNLTDLMEEDGYRTAPPNGYIQSLITLAFDVYILDYIDALDRQLLQRLRHPDQYQGARYEISIAAIFARAGWKVEWVMQTERGKKIPEFIATPPDGKRRVAVEAKSRHRAGSLHQEGVFNPEDAREGQMLYLYQSALTKDSLGIPFMIFLDLNAPQFIAKDNQAHWRDDLIRMMDVAEPGRNDKSIDSYNCLMSTNFAPHYDGKGVASSGQVVICQPFRTKYLLENEYISEIWESANKYQRVPNIFPI